MLPEGPLELLGFYSTYEELKPEIIFSIIPATQCFYSTYEELKPTYASYNAYNRICF